MCISAKMDGRTDGRTEGNPKVSRCSRKGTHKDYIENRPRPLICETVFFRRNAFSSDLNNIDYTVYVSFF